MPFAIYCNNDHIMHPTIINLICIYLTLQLTSINKIQENVIDTKHLYIYSVYYIKYYYYEVPNI